VSFEALITILGMAAVTYAIRAGGLLLAERLPAEGFVAAWMRHIPGAVIAALVAPAIVTGGMAEALAAAATALVYVMTRNLFAAIVGGVVAITLLRLFLPA
jgi:branched-subunit amino acid transport protein